MDKEFHAKLRSLKTDHGVEVVVVCKKGDCCPLEADCDETHCLEDVVN